MRASIRAKIPRFNRDILEHYKKQGRSFAWRFEKDPYKILVSEIMLQQTGVERVEKYYAAFLAKYPDFATLANARKSEVLSLWQGLGYNRRALNLVRAAGEVMERHTGKLPADSEALLRLPGVGPGTAGAVFAYAFNKLKPFVETNIRKAVISHFFPRTNSVSDSKILEIVAAAADKKNPREWYYAIVDYGHMIRKSGKVRNSRSAHYKKQSVFEGSNRQLRANLLRMALSGESVTAQAAAHKMGKERVDVQRNLDALVAEGFLEKKGFQYTAAK